MRCIGIAAVLAGLGCSYDWDHLRPLPDGDLPDTSMDVASDLQDVRSMDVPSDHGGDSHGSDLPNVDAASRGDVGPDASNGTDASVAMDVPMDTGGFADTGTPTDLVVAADMGASVDSGPVCVSPLCPCGPGNSVGYCGIGGSCTAAGTCTGSPTTGSLIITEFINWTNAVTDDPGEWLEVYNPGVSPADLRGMRLGNSRMQYTVLAGAAPVLVMGRGYGLIARNGDPTMNGGLPTPTYVLNLPLNVLTFGNMTGTISLDMGAGTPTIDSVSYTYLTWPNTRGYAKSLRPGTTDPMQRANPAYWCNAPMQWPGSLGDYGSPGVVNPPCP